MILQGDATRKLQTLQAESVHMAITSPPYWNLRDYQVAGQLGMEQTYDEYITKLCNVFDEVKRVLRSDGSLWVNLADNYSGSGGGAPSPLIMKSHRFSYRIPPLPKSDIPQKSLCLIPARFAVEMVRRGWCLRNVLIWHKPNAVPESVTDRFTVDFEYLFFFAKAQHCYFQRRLDSAIDRDLRRDAGSVRHTCSVWTIPTKGFAGNHFAVYPETLVETPIQICCPKGGVVLDPFLGTGTTAVTAQRLGRRWVGIELNPEYVALAKQRLRNEQGRAMLEQGRGERKEHHGTSPSR